MSKKALPQPRWNRLPFNARLLLLPSVGPLTRSQSAAARSALARARSAGSSRRGSAGSARSADRTRSAAFRQTPAPTYVSAWVTRYGPQRANSRQPHRLYAFKNSTGNPPVYIFNHNIRNRLSGIMGQSTNNQRYLQTLQRIIRAKAGGHPRYIANMARNILAARRRATNWTLRERGNRPPTPRELNSNAMHEKQIKLWEAILRLTLNLPNTVTHVNGNVPANVRARLRRNRTSINP